jgi:hypothetical protein
MYPAQAPWTGIGSLQGDVSSLRSELHQKADKYEIHEINRNVGSLERTVRESSSEIDGLRQRVYQLEADLSDIKQLIAEREPAAPVERKDACQICHGAKGGVPGNENVLDGVVMCDYCSVERVKEDEG